MPSAPIATVAGSTPKRRLEPGSSSGTRPCSLKGGGGGASSSFQSGSTGTSCAPADSATKARLQARRSGRKLVLMGVQVDGRLWVRLEGDAGGKFETAPGHGGVGIDALVAVVLAGSHAAA